MKARKAIFDKRIFEKETIMALYATKKAFSVIVVFVKSVQKQKGRPFSHYFKGQKADPHFMKAVQTA